MKLLEDVFQGIGSVGSTVLRGTGFGQRLFKNDLAAVMAMQNPEDQRIAMEELMNKYPGLLQLQDKMSEVAFTSPQEQRTSEQYDLLTEEQKKQQMLNPRGYRSGTAAVDPMVQAAIDKGKIQGARDKFGDDLPDETAAFFDAAATSVTERPSVKGTLEAMGQREKDKMLADLANISKSIDDTFSSKVDNRGMFSEGVNAFADEGARPQPKTEGQEEKKKASLADFFHAATEALPEENKPMTFQQAGVTSTQDQQTLQELQKAMPSVDFVTEYNADPNRMQLILKAWRDGIKDPVTGKMRKMTVKELQQLFVAAGV